MPSPGPIAPLEWTDELIESLWEYCATHRPETFFTAQFGDRIADMTAGYLSADDDICDYGCGSGHLTQHLLARHKTGAVDFSPKNIEIVRDRFEGAENFLGAWPTGDAAAFGQKFDVIYFVETVEHLLDAHIEPTFANFRSLLKPNGRIICTTPNDENLKDQEVYCPETRRYFHRYQHVRSFTEESLTALFSANGFKKVASLTTDFSARSPIRRLKATLRPRLGKKNPHLVYVGTPSES